MKYLTIMIGYSWALFVLFAAELRGAEIVFLASAGNNLAVYDTQEQLVVPNLDEAWDVDKLRDQKAKGFDKSSNRSIGLSGFTYSDVSDSSAGAADTTDKPRRRTENADSPFLNYLIVVIAAGTVGLVMIAAVAAQWRSRRSIRQNWLFPVMQEDEKSSPLPASTSIPLIAKKQMESLQEDAKSEKHIRRRAA